ncbi:hypothetical protein HYW99_02565 [Candidatus Woesearchaeota archaeon]|nr:hypothetical protein [Candidatus Woesearchaeota archaeon]MBI3026508.1 hypothetical protein [Candidatus Woesearchaeota archaeon]
MAGEIEAKFWLERPSDDLLRTLNLDNIVTYDVGQIRAKARELSGIEPEVQDFLDHFYTKTDTSRGYSAEDLTSKVSLEGNALKYSDKSLKFAVEGGKDLNSEYQGFMRLLMAFFSGEDKSAGEDTPNKYAIRLREDRATNQTYLTLKCKHGKADEQSEEYEFVVESLATAVDFLETLGYEFRPEKTKIKKQERYSFERKGIEVHVEVNGIDQLGGVRFLEIEAVPKSLDKSPRIDFVYGIARRLGIRNPRLDSLNGGNREDRRYWQLQSQVPN